jgi:hypothetical protein
MIRNLAIVASLSTAAFAQQYKAEPAASPPGEIAPAMAAMLQKDGVRITSKGTAFCELWFRTAKPPAGSSEDGASLPGIPVGTFLGAIRFNGRASDRRGQSFKSGVYILRYGLIPINGDHQGAAPQRDFLVMSLAAEDKDPNATPKFEDLTAASEKASGTKHPAVLSFWKADNDVLGLTQQGEDWVLQIKLGDTTIAVIVVGVVAS